MAQAQVQAPVRPIAQTRQQQPERRFKPAHIILYIFLALLTITSIGPLIFTFISSFKTQQDVLAFPPSLLPNPATLGNYAYVLSQSIFLRWILNAFIYAVGAMVLNMLFSAMAGYALARMNFPGKEIIFVTTLAVMMIPLAVTLIPKFLVMNSLHLTNTFFALILPAMAQPFSVFLMVQ